MPSLQQPNLLAALYKQKKAGIMAPEDAAGLEAAYIFLRRTEHMLQYREDEQTHLLPRDAQRHAALAQAMGMETRVFETTLAAHRTFVARAFRTDFRIAGMGDPEGKQAAPATPSAQPDGGIPAPAGAPPAAV